MKVIALLSAILAAVFSSSAMAQNQGGAVRSPEVTPDKHVIFRLNAPKATEVTLTGDWLAPNTTLKLEKDDRGVWSVNVGPMQPGFMIYNFNMDGLAIADPINPRMKLRASTSASVVEVPGDGKQLWEIQDVPHGKVQLNYFPSKVLNTMSREVRVYTPPGYDAATDKKYPVMYLFHGTNDTAAGWTEIGRANYVVDNLIAQKKAVPMIVVMPWGHAAPYGAGRGAGASAPPSPDLQLENTLTFVGAPPPLPPAPATPATPAAPGAPAGRGGRGGGGTNNNDALFERYLLEDVIPAVEKEYRVAPGRENRAIVGLSMGGGQAITIGFGHVDLFSSVAAFSAPVPGDFATRYKALLDDPAGTNAKMQAIYIGCGKSDPAFSRSQQLDTLLTTNKINHTFNASEGFHNYINWRLYLGETVPLLFQPKAK